MQAIKIACLFQLQGSVGMVQMYSKSVNVNDLHGFCVDRPDPSLHGLALFLFLRFFRQVVCHALQIHTAPSLHLHLFLKKNIFMHPSFLAFYVMQIVHGQPPIYLKGFQTTVTTKECAPNAW